MRQQLSEIDLIFCTGLIKLMKEEEDHRTSGKQRVTRSTAIATYRIGLSYPNVEPWTIAIVVGSTRTRVQQKAIPTVIR